MKTIKGKKIVGWVDLEDEPSLELTHIGDDELDEPMPLTRIEPITYNEEHNGEEQWFRHRDKKELKR